MTAETTQGIRVSIKTRFLGYFSTPETRPFLFAYTIKIENTSDFTVQLLRRHWTIFDSTGDYREVDGEGVIGKQPVLAPGESFQYESRCDLASDIGTMKGSYLMERIVSGERFKIKIPSFTLVHPNRLN